MEGTEARYTVIVIDFASAERPVRVFEPIRLQTGAFAGRGLSVWAPRSCQLPALRLERGDLDIVQEKALSWSIRGVEKGLPSETAGATCGLP